MLLYIYFILCYFMALQIVNLQTKKVWEFLRIFVIFVFFIRKIVSYIFFSFLSISFKAVLTNPSLAHVVVLLLLTVFHLMGRTNSIHKKNKQSSQKLQQTNTCATYWREGNKWFLQFFLLLADINRQKWSTATTTTTTSCATKHKI